MIVIQKACDLLVYTLLGSCVSTLWFGNLLGTIIGRRCALANASIAIGELSVRITDPIDMKKLPRALGQQNSTDYERRSRRVCTHPNVAADPTMYCPKVLITPAEPAPNRMILVDPERLLLV